MMQWLESRGAHAALHEALRRGFEERRYHAALTNPPERSLAELRRARHLSQETLARRLATTQTQVSRLERRTDLHLSTLRGYIEAMGGRLELIARFADRSARIRLG